MTKDIDLITKKISEIQGHFFIPSYQRGYRWGKDEVTRLLDDILTGYQTDRKTYYLQPIVVRKTDDFFELIDGQQRLTTIYLIYKYIHNTDNTKYNAPNFSLDYETRDQSAQFLKNIDLSKKDDNIDFWFFATAYETIQKWFEKNNSTHIDTIRNYFENNVKVIWYEVGQSVDPISLFTRLNIGKIPLTNAELVKAMFLSQGNTNVPITDHQKEIALQWDTIEKELHYDSLWYFLSDQKEDCYQTRIDLVLDLIDEEAETAEKTEKNGNTKKTKEKYHTFFKFDEMRNTTSLPEIWEKIHQTFLILKGWHEDHELYHKIGYLIASDFKTIQELFDLSRKKTKTEFLSVINTLMKASIPENYTDLSYEKITDHKNLKRLLLLFNVESVRQKGKETQWFPFNKFKTEPVSLEHIHAQHSEGLKTQEAWKNWLELHIPFVEKLSNDQDTLLQEMKDAANKKTLSKAEFDTLHPNVVARLSANGNTITLHTIDNLALLSTSANAALNNSTFAVKRDEIIKMDKNAKYIPFCTRMVFLKYYTPSEKNQIHFWGQDDREAYQKAIENVLKNISKRSDDIERSENNG